MRCLKWTVCPATPCRIHTDWIRRTEKDALCEQKEGHGSPPFRIDFHCSSIDVAQRGNRPTVGNGTNRGEPYRRDIRDSVAPGNRCHIDHSGKSAGRAQIRKNVSESDLRQHLDPVAADPQRAPSTRGENGSYWIPQTTLDNSHRGDKKVVQEANDVAASGPKTHGARISAHQAAVPYFGTSLT